jgi:hypothetical protein
MSVKPEGIRAVLIGASHFPKDRGLVNFAAASANLQKLSEALADARALGLPAAQLSVLLNTPDNIVIKEQLASAAENASELLLVYITGHAVLRRGQLYFATASSSREQIHVNGLSLAEIAAIIREPEDTPKLIVIDAVFGQANAGGAAETAAQVQSELMRLEEGLRRASVVMSSPLVSPENFYNTPAGSPLTHLISLVMKNGVRKEVGTITAADAYDYATRQLEHEGVSLPIAGDRARMRQLTLANNVKYNDFYRLSAEADTLFERQQYEQALPLYQSAAQLFENNQELNKRIRFICLLLDAVAQQQRQELENARRNYQDALQLFAVEQVRTRLDQITEKIATQYFDKGNYEQAQTNYELLVRRFPENEFFRKRLEQCKGEMAFAELIDRGDRYYFQDDFLAAVDAYTKALAINHDAKAQRRKEECERLLSKEQQLRRKLEDELKSTAASATPVYVPVVDENALENARQQARESARQEVYQEVEQTLREQLYGEIARHFKEQADRDIWRIVAELDTPEAYKCYLTIFPDGQHHEAAENALKPKFNPQDEVERAKNVLTDLIQVKKVNGYKTTETPETPELPQAETYQQPFLFDSAPKSVSEQPAETVAETNTAEDDFIKLFSTEDAPIFNMAEDNAFHELLESAQPPISVIEEASPLSQMTEDDLWQHAQSENTVESFMAYIEHTKEFKHITDAYYYINRIKQNMLQDEPHEETPKPITNHAAKAAAESISAFSAAKEDEDDLLWERAHRENTVHAYYQYLNSSVKRKYADQAKRHIQELNDAIKNSETIDWEDAVKTDTIEAYNTYLEKYPFGNYYAKARFRIMKLESELHNS